MSYLCVTNGKVKTENGKLPNTDPPPCPVLASQWGLLPSWSTDWHSVNPPGTPFATREGSSYNRHLWKSCRISVICVQFTAHRSSSHHSPLTIPRSPLTSHHSPLTTHRSPLTPPFFPQKSTKIDFRRYIVWDGTIHSLKWDNVLFHGIGHWVLSESIDNTFIFKCIIEYNINDAQEEC